MSQASTTKTHILETALGLSSQFGLSALTLGSLAQKAGMSKSGLFAHFKDKEKLQLGVLELAVQKFSETVFKPAILEPRGSARIRTLVKGWVEFIDGPKYQPGGSVLIAASTELDDCPGLLRNFVQKSQRELITNLARAARISVEVGEFKKNLDCQQFAWTLYSLILGYHHFAKLLDDPTAKKRLQLSIDDLIQTSQSVDRDIKGGKKSQAVVNSGVKPKSQQLNSSLKKVRKNKRVLKSAKAR